MKPARAFASLLAEAPRGQVIALFALMLAGALTEGVGLLLLVPMLDVLAGGGSPHPLVRRLTDGLAAVGMTPTAGGLLAGFLGLVALRSGLQHASERLGTALRLRLVDRLRLRCFSALLGVEWRWLVGTKSADHANLLLTDVGRVGVGLHFGLSLVVAMVTMAAYLLAAIALSWKMTLLALASGAFVFALLARQRRHALRLGQDLTTASRSLHGNVQESLAGIKLAKILGSEHRQLEFFTRTTRQLQARQLQFTASTSLSQALFHIGGAALLASYLYVGLTVWHTPVPELLTLVLIFSRLIPQFMGAQQHVHHVLHALPALQQADRLLLACRAHAEPPGHEAPQAWPLNEALCLDRVGFKYDDREHPALDGVSIRFGARTTTAIMGASGAGKSTLADLLMGLITPDAGQLTVDGAVIGGSSRRSWRRHVAYVPQDVFLFNDSVRNNLLWARPDAQPEALRRAVTAAAAEFVFDLPQGLETVVGDGGVRLSGGERQRIALARALLERPSLLILDEATSSLDIANEARIRQAIERLRGDLTVVIIGHRLPTLEHADQVIVLDKGRVCAQGTWAEVRAQQEARHDPAS